MIHQLPHAGLRAVLVIVVALMPMMILPDQPPAVVEAVVLIALFAGVFTLVEYASIYPGLVEFRDAPPFNRVRFGLLTVMLALIAVALTEVEGAAAPVRLVQSVGLLLGQSIDLPYSPLRVVMASLPEGTTVLEARIVRMTGGLAYLVALMALTVFSILIRVRAWPAGPHGFNVWINLPTFDPTAGADVVARLRRDGVVNILLGLLLPYATPPLAMMLARLYGLSAMENPLALCWTMTLWAFLPASLFLRGIALRRLALMIETQRRRYVDPEAPVERDAYAPRPSASSSF